MDSGFVKVIETLLSKWFTWNNLVFITSDFV